MSAAPSLKAADAIVSEVPYQGQGSKRNTQATDAKTHDRAPAKPQPEPASKKVALSAYMTIAAAAFGLISDGCMYSRYARIVSETADGVHFQPPDRPEQSLDHGQCQSRSRSPSPAPVSAVTSS